MLSVDYKATMASIMWLHPNGSEVFSGPIVRNSRPSVTLNIRETTLEDSGNWTCIVTVEGINVTTANGMVNNAVIGMKSVRISVSSVGKAVFNAGSDVILFVLIHIVLQ